MRVHSIEAIPIDIPLGTNFGGSTYAVLKRSTIVTRVRTDAGLVSEVYNGDNREHGLAIARLIHGALAPRIQGMSLFDGERIWEAMFALSHVSRDRKVLLEGGRRSGRTARRSRTGRWRSRRARASDWSSTNS